MKSCDCGDCMACDLQRLGCDDAGKLTRERERMRLNGMAEQWRAAKAKRGQRERSRARTIKIPPELY